MSRQQDRYSCGRPCDSGVIARARAKGTRSLGGSIDGLTRSTLFNFERGAKMIQDEPPPTASAAPSALRTEIPTLQKIRLVKVKGRKSDFKSRNWASRVTA